MRQPGFFDLDERYRRLSDVDAGVYMVESSCPKHKRMTNLAAQNLGLNNHHI